jgi:ribonuclease HI
MINEDTKAKEKIVKQRIITIYVDGACRGNNQKDRDKRISGIGFHYKIDDFHYNGSMFVKAKTNIEAEFQAIEEGLKDITKDFIGKNHTILVKSDCLFCVDRLNYIFPLKSSRLLQFFNRIKKLEGNFKDVYYKHILRTSNTYADELANKGIDDYLLNKKPLDHIDLLTNLLKNCESEEIFKEIKEAIQHSSLKELKGILRIK